MNHFQGYYFSIQFCEKYGSTICSETLLMHTRSRSNFCSNIVAVSPRYVATEPYVLVDHLSCSRLTDAKWLVRSIYFICWHTQAWNQQNVVRAYHR